MAIFFGFVVVVTLLVANFMIVEHEVGVVKQEFREEQKKLKTQMDEIELCLKEMDVKLAGIRKDVLDEHPYKKLVEHLKEQKRWAAGRGFREKLGAIVPGSKRHSS